MLFVTILTIDPRRNREVYQAIKELKPPGKISVRWALGLFGEYDAILTYEAPDENAAMDFLLDLIKIEGITDTRTFAAVKLR